MVCKALIKLCCLIAELSSHYIHYHGVVSFPQMVFSHRHQILAVISKNAEDVGECDMNMCLPNSK